MTAYRTLIIALVTAEPDPYAVLGVRPDATTSTISAAYRTLARRHHPDVSGDLNAERRMAVINAAWAILRDPERRAAWDREHAPKAPPPDRGSTHRTGHGTASRHAATASPSAQAAPMPAPARPRRAGVADPTARARQARRRATRGAACSPFGRHIGWSLGEIARVDPGYLHWLAGHREGGRYRAEIDAILAPMLSRAEPKAEPRRRRAIFR